MKDKLKKCDDTGLLSYLVHEVRTPLVCTQSMLRDILAGEKIERAKIESCESSVTDLLNYLNQVLDMLKISEGKLKLKVEPITMKAIEEILHSFFDRQATERQIKFEVEIQECPFQYIYIDKGVSLQIASNLIGNALKYTAASGMVKVKIKVEKIEEYRGLFQAEIIDNGKGMSPEFLEKAFLPFTQESGYLPGKGAGLGLNLSKKLIDLWGGDLQIQSQKGVGTTVNVRLEVDAADEDYSVKTDTDDIIEKETRVFQGENLRGKKLLIAENDEVIMEWMVASFEKYGVWVDKTYDGNEVIALFEESELFEYDAILMDLGMPECNGIEAAFQIRRLKREDAEKIPILAFTGFPIENEEEFLQKHNMQRVIPKTLNEEEVVQVLGEIWESYGKTR